MTTELPQCLMNGGRISRRQTTFWDLTSQDDEARVRTHFDHKVEFQFVAPEFDRPLLLKSHPILADYEEPVEAIFISSPARDPDRLLLDLHTAAAEFFDGWRAIDRYLNPDYPAQKLLAEGFGMLMRVPVPFAAPCKQLLTRGGVRVDAPLQPTPPRGPMRALVLGRNFVVAHDFRFELHRGGGRSRN